MKGRTRKVEFLKKELSSYTQEVCVWFLKGLDKNLGIGIKAKLINKVFPGLISDFEVMLAERQTRERFEKTFGNTEYVYGNLKIDGIRCLCFVEHDGSVKMYSRAGFVLQDSLTELIRKEIERNIDKFRGFVLDGEIYSKRFHKLQRLIMRKNLTSDTIGLRNSCRFAIFDAIPIDNYRYGQEEGIVRTPLERRIQYIEGLGTGYNFIRFTKYLKIKADYTYVLRLMKYYLDKGYEGLMIKHPKSGYSFKRVYEWMKFKGKDDIDLEIIRCVEGEGKYKGSLGAIVVNFEGNEVSVGTGFTDEERDWIWSIRSKIPGRVAEISYREVTHLGSLKDPRFECIRFDKGKIDENSD
jgi:DNA ligase-1